MTRKYTMTPVVQAAVAAAVAEGLQWVAYNTTFLVLDTEDLFFTDNPMEAAWYADFKTNEIDQYSFRQFDSLEDFLYKISQTKEPAFFIEQKTNNMNNENVDFLHNQIKYAGFGEDLHRALVQQLKADPGEFTLQHAHTFGKDNVDSVLNFKRSKESDMYFFNSYDTTVKREGKPDISNTFYINQGQNITLREAYNLLNGRSVEKELLRNLSPAEKEQYKAEWKLPKEQRFLPENWEKPPHYTAWVKLDLEHRDKHGNFIQKHFNENYGFKLDAALAKLPLRNMNASEMADLTSSLQKGNLAQATFSVDDANKKFLLAVDPQWKAIQVYNMDMTLAKKETYSQNTKKESEGQEQVPAQKETNGVQKDNVQQTTVQQPVQAAGKDLVAGPEAPWEGKKTDVAKPAEEKKTEVAQHQGKEEKPAQKNDNDITKVDLLKKGKEGNGLIEKKGKAQEGKAMKVA